MHSFSLKIIFGARNYVRMYARCSNFKFRQLSQFSVSESSEITENAAETLKNSESMVEKVKLNKGGDINMASLLGTVIGLKFFPMQSDPSREWCLIFLRTKTVHPNESTLSENPEVQRIHSCSNRVHVFDRRMLSTLRDAKIGDRIFVTGFLSYYNRLATSETGRTLPKLCALVAQRLVFMGSVVNCTNANEASEVE